jgi:hypothetical protein
VLLSPSLLQGLGLRQAAHHWTAILITWRERHEWKLKAMLCEAEQSKRMEVEKTQVDGRWKEGNGWEDGLTRHDSTYSVSAYLWRGVMLVVAGGILGLRSSQLASWLCVVGFDKN